MSVCLFVCVRRPCISCLLIEVVAFWVLSWLSGPGIYGYCLLSCHTTCAVIRNTLIDTKYQLLK